MGQQHLEYFFVECQCNDKAHTIRFVFDPHTGHVWVDVKLRSYTEFIERVKTATKYLIEDPHSYHEYAYSSLKIEQLKGLRTIIDKAIEFSEKSPPIDPDKSGTGNKGNQPV